MSKETETPVPDHNREHSMFRQAIPIDDAALIAYFDKIHVERDEARKERDEAKAAQERVIADLKADKERLDGLQEVPFVVIITYNMAQPKADSAPTCRQQIDQFLISYRDRKSDYDALYDAAIAQTKAKEGGK